MEKRTLLAVILSIAVLFVYQNFFAPKKPPATAPAGQTQEGTPTQTQTPAASAPATAAPGTPVAQVPTGGVLPTLTTAPPLIPEQDVIVETAQYRAVFSTRGGALRSFQLKAYQKTLGDEEDLVDKVKRMLSGRSKPLKPEGVSPLIELVDIRKDMPLPLTLTFPDSTLNIPGDGAFQASVPSLDLTRSAESQRLVFTQTIPRFLKVEKIFTFHPEKYQIDLDVTVTNLSAQPITQNAALGWFQYVDPGAPVDSYGHDGPVIYVQKGIEREDVKEMKPDKLLGPDVSWGGYESKYFIAAMIPQKPTLTHLSLGKDANQMISVGLRGPKNLVPSGQSGLFSYTLYLGPKDYSLLKTPGVGLENAIDFGDWLKWLAMPLLLALKFLYGYVHNYGIAIIILTTLIKLLFWPLGNKSYKSMKEMQKLQPKIMELREKFKNDKARMSQETMALYKVHKVNPMGGCLPMVVQIPVFFGLYKALLYAIELRHSPFFWWVQDLSAKDPYYITPIIMGATMFIQQKMTPTPGDPMQAKIMLFMPIIFTFMFLNFPSGLVIYWLFNNLLSIGQQYYVNKRNT